MLMLIDIHLPPARPRCPQVPIDVYHLLRVPKHAIKPASEREDELNCLNLNVTVPVSQDGTLPANLPVLLWIHGMDLLG